MTTKEAIERVTKGYVDQGKIIEAGFAALRMVAIPSDAPLIQVDEMRNAFFCGAHHLFASIMAILEPGAEPTEADLKRMDLIDHELQEFLAEYKRTHQL